MARRRHYRGVMWEPIRRIWRVRLCHKERKYSFGYYHDQEYAARIYDALALELRGPSATINFNGILPAGVTREHIRVMLANRGLR